ncbi:MAG: hypothetical protein ACOVO1_06630 [Chitinophagaceae bacterium]
MRNLFLVVIICSIGFISCNSNDTFVKKLDKKSYQDHKASLLDNEKKSPKDFLTITGTDHRNFWGKTVYEGVIHNTASVCSYKNVRVKLLYYKNDGTLVTNHEELFDETVKPGNNIEFKAKYKTPKGTDSVAASIMSATALGEN